MSELGQAIVRGISEPALGTARHAPNLVNRVRVRAIWGIMDRVMWGIRVRVIWGTGIRVIWGHHG